VRVYTPAVQITLSSGEIVHLKPWKRKADKVFNLTLMQGVLARTDPEGNALPTDMPVVNLGLAYEAVLPFVIARIEKAGGEVPFTEAWRDDLEPKDYQAVEDAVRQIKGAANASGEKNP
jgi:hypothetical protein